MLRPNKTTGLFLMMLGCMFFLGAALLALSDPPANRMAAASGCVGMMLILWGSRSFRV